jgi:valyl-tRNA synthetase
MLEKTFDPKSVEPRLYAAWEASGAFKPSDDPNAETFTIVIPPPNVTGSLHIGHALNNTLQDVLTRFTACAASRPCGCRAPTTPASPPRWWSSASWPPPATIGRRDMGREAFVAKVWEWKAESGGTIVNQLRRLGASCDWSRERFTLDEGLSAAVRKVFVQLHKQGLIYRDKRLVNWDPQFQTAISDLEVEQKEVDGAYWHFAYPLADGVTGSTPRSSRPATSSSSPPRVPRPCWATPPSPCIRRTSATSDLVGKDVILPIVGRRIPIVADDYADPEKGSGAVKITPAHDFNDFRSASATACRRSTSSTPDAA